MAKKIQTNVNKSLKAVEKITKTVRKQKAKITAEPITQPKNKGKNTSGLKRWSTKAQYENYVQKYKEQAKRVASKYGVAMEAPMYTERQFSLLVKAERERLRDEGKSPANATRNLIQRQTYAGSYKQGIAALKGYLEVFGDKLSATERSQMISQFRFKNKLSDAWYDLIAQERKRLLAQGKSKAEIAELIAEEFYGS